MSAATAESRHAPPGPTWRARPQAPEGASRWEPGSQSPAQLRSTSRTRPQGEGPRGNQGFPRESESEGEAELNGDPRELLDRRETGGDLGHAVVPEGAHAACHCLALDLVA